MTSRTDEAVAMTSDERISALVYLGQHHPEVFDEVLADIEHQRRIREKREGAAREDGDERG